MLKDLTKEFVIAVFILLSIVIISTLLCFYSVENFCFNFFGNFFSDIIIFIAFSYFFVRYYENKNQPSPMLFANDSSTEITIEKNKLEKDKFEIEFSIFNANSKMLNKDTSYFHILIPQILMPKITDGTNPRKNEIGLLYDISDLIKIPCLPHRHTNILKLEWKYPDFRAFRGLREIKFEIRYFIATENGLFPKTIKLLTNGQPNIDTVRKINFNFI